MIQYQKAIEKYLVDVTLWMTALSLVTLFILVVVRFFSDRISHKNVERKRRIIKLLLIHLENPLSDLKKLLIEKKRDMDLLAEAIPVILRNLKNESRQKFLKALDEVGLYKWVGEKLFSGNKKMMIRAMSILNYWQPDESMKKRLQELLKSDDHFIQYAALEALANTRDEAVLPAILAAFKKRESFSYPVMSDALHKFGPHISQVLANLVQEKNVPLHVKVPALMALAQTSDIKNIVASSLMAVHNKNDDFRAFAFRSLARSGEAVPLEIIEHGYRDPYWRVRLYSANCSANIRPLPAKILMTLLNDENSMVSLQAARALFSAGEAGKQLLALMAKSENRAGKRAKMILLEEEAEHGIS